MGDIDIYGGVDKYKKINEIIMKLGGSVEEDYYWHWHAASHFMFEKKQLRHIYDWKVFLENEAAEVDENLYLNVKAKISYGKFADILTSLAVRLYGVKVDSLPEVFKKGLEQMDDRLVDRVIS